MSEGFNATKREIEILEVRTENARLRKGIQDYLDGNYGSNIPRKVDMCEHGLFGWEACENCIDAYFSSLLSPSHSEKP